MPASVSHAPGTGPDVENHAPPEHPETDGTVERTQGGTRGQLGGALNRPSSEPGNPDVPSGTPSRLKAAARRTMDASRATFNAAFPPAPVNFAPSSIVIPRDKKEAFMEGAAAGGTAIATATASSAVFPNLLAASPWWGAAVALPAALGGLGLMIGDHHGRPMTGLAIGSLAGSGISMAALQATGLAQLSGGLLASAAFLPAVGAMGGYMLGRHMGHPILGLAGGTALSTYASMLMLSGSAATMATMWPILVGAGVVGAGAFAAHMGYTAIRDVWQGKGNPLTTNTIGLVTGLLKGFIPNEQNIHGIEHVTAIPGKLVQGLFKGFMFSQHKNITGVEHITSAPGRLLYGFGKGFTGFAPEGAWENLTWYPGHIVRSVGLSPLNAVTGLWRGFSGKETNGVVQGITSAPGRFMRYLLSTSGSTTASH